MSPQVHCAQLNLRHSSTAKDNFDLHPSKIQLLQEPPLNYRKTHALSRKDYVVYASEPVGGEGPRAALRISKSIASSALAYYKDRDRSVAVVRIGGRS